MRLLSKVNWAFMGSLILLGLLGVLVSLIPGKTDLFFAFSDFDRVEKSDTYVRVGPVISSVNSGDLVIIKKVLWIISI